VTVFLNGRFVEEEEAVVSVFDRGFLYGDGLFETMRVLNRKVFRWEQHIERLRGGLEYVKLKFALDAAGLREAADKLVSANEMPDSLLRLTVSRGVGRRGYSPAGAEKPTLVMSLHLFVSATPQEGWSVITSNVRLPAGQPLAAYKTCSKLPQILARMEADDAGADEALLLNTEGFVVEGASSNLFWVEEDQVCTPPIPSGILAGVTRVVVLEICGELGIAARESALKPGQLAGTDGAFLSLSSAGVVPIRSVDGREMPVSPIITQLGTAYQDLLRRETR
jgi:aminodeoxychorismate lyase